ncbi:hypothetical protein E2C01_009645 [Portunus trituberculatus]|uniref:Uncharacterized protein n=1 Tax=Portunus trituberculatus TaxID=210409 RepID=A0A5B7D6B1_PORTR|nr:hypothetical protein [Portunus trituberculatus]
MKTRPQMREEHAYPAKGLSFTCQCVPFLLRCFPATNNTRLVFSSRLALCEEQRLLLSVSLWPASFLFRVSCVCLHYRMFVFFS